MPKAIVSNTHECSGNGRSRRARKACGNPWTAGGVGNTIWGGVWLTGLLVSTGLTDRAPHVAFEGMDIPLGKSNPDYPQYSNRQGHGLHAAGIQNECRTTTPETWPPPEGDGLGPD
jgi:DMSO/TMAO reductase YedYZ molybdopterin-dependent catalytic subunit